MANGNAHIADSLDTVHHEKDHVVHDQFVYKSVWQPIIEQPTLEKDPAIPHDEFAVA